MSPGAPSGALPPQHGLGDDWGDRGGVGDIAAIHVKVHLHPQGESTTEPDTG